MKFSWHRFPVEARISLLGSLLISSFLLFISAETAVSSLATGAPDALGLVIFHLVVVAAIACLFIVSMRVVVEMRDRPRWIQPLLIAIGVPVIVCAGLFDWTMACVWVVSVFLIFGGRVGLIVFSITIGILLVVLYLTGESANDQLLMVSISVFSIFAIYAPIRLVVVSEGLVRSREELARYQIDKERFRISRELHALIGRTLVAHSLRGQAAIRLLELGRLEEAATQLHLANDIAIDGQAKLRELTQGPMFTDFRVEVTSAQGLCERLGIIWESDIEEIGSPESQRLAAEIVREAITNMLKYSHPTKCRLMLRLEDEVLVLTLVNDGCPLDLQANPAGTGLREMSRRCSEVGGMLEAGSPQAGLFRVLANIPKSIALDTEES